MASAREIRNNGQILLSRLGVQCHQGTQDRNVSMHPTHNYFAHESPTPEKKTSWDQAKLVGTTASGENICRHVYQMGE